MDSSTKKKSGVTCILEAFEVTRRPCTRVFCIEGFKESISDIARYSRASGISSVHPEC